MRVTNVFKCDVLFYCNHLRFANKCKIRRVKNVFNCKCVFFVITFDLQLSAI